MNGKKYEREGNYPTRIRNDAPEKKTTRIMEMTQQVPESVGEGGMMTEKFVEPRKGGKNHNRFALKRQVFASTP